MPGEKALEARREPTPSSTHICRGQGIEPGPDWWEVVVVAAAVAVAAVVVLVVAAAAAAAVVVVVTVVNTKVCFLCSAWSLPF